MVIGKVIGTVVSTRKNDDLTGCKLMVIENIWEKEQVKYVAVDQVGAGIGDFVLVTYGSAARMGVGKEYSSIDAAIVGIIDNEEEIYIK